MDALLAAELLARREVPDMFRLVEQRYRVMAESFREEHGRAFALEKLSQAVYEWRRSGEPYIKTEGLEQEVAALARDRLMIQRTELFKTGEGERQVNHWCFRHDKIMDFFLLPAFMDEKKAAPSYENVDNYVPFIGVYELLAVWLPDDEEKRLYKRLIDRAADTNSNELLNRYTVARRLRSLARSRGQTGEVLRERTGWRT
jgi:hypothetical protein